MSMGKRIHTAREKLNLTEQDLADKLHICKATISAYENDRVDIKSSRVVEIAKALEVSVGYLYGEDSLKNELDKDEIDMLNLFSYIKNSKLRKMAIKQIKAIVDVS